MSTKHDDQLALSHLALIDMERAQQSVEYSHRANEKALKAALFREAVVSYAKPFSSNRYSDGKKGLRISENHVPKEMMIIHNQVLALRDKFIAHTDMAEQRPIVEKFKNEKGYDYSVVITGYETIDLDELIDPLFKLAQSVHKSLCRKRSSQIPIDF